MAEYKYNQIDKLLLDNHPGFLDACGPNHPLKKKPVSKAGPKRKRKCLKCHKSKPKEGTFLCGTCIRDNQRAPKLLTTTPVIFNKSVSRN